VRDTQQPWVTSDLGNDTRFPELAWWLGDRGIRSLCVVPATTALRKLGALAFGSRLESAYAENDVIFLQQVARQVAVAVDNALNFEQAQSVQTQLKEERDRWACLDISSLLIQSGKCSHPPLIFPLILHNLIGRPRNSEGVALR
jgi:GAF domain-containing protein